MKTALDYKEEIKLRKELENKPVVKRQYEYFEHQMQVLNVKATAILILCSILLSLTFSTLMFVLKIQTTFILTLYICSAGLDIISIIICIPIIFYEIPKSVIRISKWKKREISFYLDTIRSSRDFRTRLIHISLITLSISVIMLATALIRHFLIV
ncbi:MAG: hypothetical protein ACTSQI_20600 [Candidatus Helarchaeota archaeon]